MSASVGIVTTTAHTSVLHHFFEASARRWPQHVAVDVPPGSKRPTRAQITYRELDAASDALARRFARFITSECVVCILLPRTSFRIYAAQLAVLKSGAAYTCIDPSWPNERVRDIIVDTDTPVLLTDAAGLARTEASGKGVFQRIDVEAVLPDSVVRSEPAEAQDPAPWLTPESLSYVIYTSGTTGRPKGVMIEHRSISNLVESDLETFRLSTEDRVAQGSSAAYDSSLEEAWLAFAAGATLVVMDDETMRLGPDLIPWLRRERITVFCPPPTLLRATGCKDARETPPELRLLYVGGEALHPDLAEIWAQGRELVNGYGPTECTVTCLRDRIEPGQDITIGRAVRGVNAWVLNEELEETTAGERGELCIGGVGLARGYWKQPDRTSERFTAHPRLGRVYRTGDIAHTDAEGRFFYHGRMDSQVKLRGYRIELEEIEARLAQCRGVRDAACCVRDDNGSGVLLAFVVPEDAGCAPRADDIKAELACMLPKHMVPARIGYVSHVPITTGGKLDRTLLPNLNATEPAEHEHTLPRNVLEERIQAAFTGILGSTPRSIHEDFFDDLGGDSLNAAQVVTVLRDDPATEWITVRDLYESRTVAALSGRAPSGSPSSVHELPYAETVQSTGTGRTRLVTLVQTAFILKDLVIGSILAYAGVFLVLPAVTAALGLVPMLVLGIPAMLLGLALYALVTVSWAVWTKRRLIGRYEPTRAPVWSGFYLRNWIVQQSVRAVPWWLLEGTEFHNVALRALGARIGRRVHIHRGVDLRRGGWDLLAIGDDVTIGRDVALGLFEYEAGHVVLGKVTLGSGATLEANSYVGADACVEANGYLTARSSLPRGAQLPEGECWDGIPAAPSGPAPPAAPIDEGGQVLSPWVVGLCMLLSRLALAGIIAAPAELLSIGVAVWFGLDEDAATAWLMRPTFGAGVLLTWMLVCVASVPLTLAVEALTCRALGRVGPGVISRWSWAYIRIWVKTGLVNSGCRWLYGSLMMPLWLRLAGMKVGHGCEISTLIDTLPELITVGDQTFCTDGVYLGGAKIHRGTVTMAASQLGDRNFIGNGAVIAGGVSLPDDILLGICTTADPSKVRAGTSWFGHPAFQLRRHEANPFDRRLTHDPTIGRVLTRLFWELARFGLPAGIALLGIGWYAVLATLQSSLSLPVFILAGVPFASLSVFLAATALVVGLKWLLLGRVRPAMHPLWSCWTSRWDFFCLTWSLYAEAVVLTLDGTMWLSTLLRSVGVSVGKNVVFGSRFAGVLATPDMLRIEDGATVDCLFQDHTFEDRVLKTDYVTVRRNATVGRNVVLLYGAEIGAGTYVAPNSVVMKHERLTAGRRYEGFPVHERIGAAH